MKRFVLRILLFLVPFAALLAIEIFLLPIDFFTFRVWEALKTDSMSKYLPGYFYPDMSVTKVEEGDLGHHSVNGVKRRVEWRTDRGGYRNSWPASECGTLIIGDSNGVGTGLTQEDTPARALARELGAKVYSFAPGSVNAYLKEQRFLDHPPSLVILLSIERQVVTLRPVKKELVSPSAFERQLIRARSLMSENRMVEKVAIPVDRAFKAIMLHYVRAEIRRNLSLSTPGGGKGEGQKRVLFLPPGLFGHEVPEALLKESVKVIAGYRDAFERRGVRFLFLPIPDKENIYHDLVPLKEKPLFLTRLVPALRKEGIETVDVLNAFEGTYRENGPELYLSDDTHWGAEGVRIAARLIKQEIAGKAPLAGAAGGMSKTP
ncbi:MAG TPA: hypothetical protein VGJ94_08850 [Syntrophorhabdaceae bacterium]|jgi:hypothetical protein